MIDPVVTTMPAITTFAAVFLAGLCLALLARRRSLVPLAANRTDMSFETLAAVAPAGIWRTDAQGQCQWVNKAWEDMTGLTDWRGEGWGTALHPDDRERLFASFMTAVARRERFEDEWRWLRPDGSSLWVRGLGAPEYDARGELVGYVGINIDIQQSKDLEADLHLARERAEHEAQAKSTFLANMSHEIRTPMNGVIGFTELLSESRLDSVQREQVRMIADSGRAMMQLLNDILDHARIESGQVQIAPEPTDLRRKLQHCIKLIEPMARAKGLSLGVWVDDAVPVLLDFDRLRLRQVVLNLLGNAVKFTPSGSIDLEARVENSSEGQWVLISVIDTGIGIAADKLEAIFQPFTQQDGSVARRYGGTGLGLTISSELVRMMGGRITIDSRPGVGSQFSVRLPLVASRAPASRLDAPAPMPEELNGGLAGTRLLIAEDHVINQQLVLAMARSLGIEARVVEDGTQAVAAVIEADSAGVPYDAVLMDMQMPGVDGLEATRRLRAQGFDEQRLPIIALTANCYPDDVAACTAAGMQSHLGKPVTTIALARELARWIGTTDRADDAAIPLAAFPASPHLAGLEEKYRSRKEEIVGQLRSTLDAAGKASGADWTRLADELHKLAGVAANFGEVELGEASRRLERRIKTAQASDDLIEALRQEWPIFESAA